MSSLNRKKKFNLGERITQNFRQINIENIQNKNDYDDIEECYKKIKTYYINKINAKQIDINIERIRLENSIGKYNGYYSSVYITMIISIFSATMVLIMQEFLKSLKINNYLGNAWFLMILFAIAAFSIGKEFKKDKTKDFTINLSIKVLDEIKREIIQRNSTTSDDIAATSVKELNKYHKICLFERIAKSLLKLFSGVIH